MQLPLIASSPQPTSTYDLLRARGVHRQPEGWAVTGAADVDAALTSPLLRVVAPAVPDGEAADLVSRMARFSDGEQHRRRRAVVEQLLPPVEGLQEAARARATQELDRAEALVDAMVLARTVPVAVLADALAAGDVGADVGELCDALAPSLLPGRPSGDDAARAVREAVTAAGCWTAEQVDAVISLLFQARDATAALIGGALLHGAPVEQVLRAQAPTQCTLRVAAQDVPLAGASVPAGDRVWVLLGSVPDAEPPMTFGRGAHACPGAAQATALARGVVEALVTGGWRRVAEQPVQWEPRPNLRMPSLVLVERS
jgi:cytochrome P450